MTYKLLINVRLYDENKKQNNMNIYTLISRRNIKNSSSSKPKVCSGFESIRYKVPSEQYCITNTCMLPEIWRNKKKKKEKTRILQYIQQCGLTSDTAGQHYI